MTLRPLTAAELFDAVGATYEVAFGHPPVVRRATRDLLGQLPPAARVLDIGSGTGRPVAAELAAAGHRVTGLDVSAVMVELARAQVPDAEFVQVDVRNWSSPEASWDAVCAFFPFLQMPRSDTAAVLERVARWLVPGGMFLAITVPADLEEAPGDFLGYPVALTSFTPDALSELIGSVGLVVESCEVEHYWPEGDAAPEDHLLIVARRPT